MTTHDTLQSCFNCSRTEAEIPVSAWSYKQQSLTVCSACMPLLIHKWERVAAMLDGQSIGENDG